MCVVSSRIRTPRENWWTRGGPPPSSNIVIVPSGWMIALCWNAVVVPRPILKLDFLPPSVQMTWPVRRLIL